nr:hypothetical protein Iba_contig2819CG0010 [Ipomoea batatas]
MMFGFELLTTLKQCCRGLEMRYFPCNLLQSRFHTWDSLELLEHPIYIIWLLMSLFHLLSTHIFIQRSLCIYLIVIL